MTKLKVLLATPIYPPEIGGPATYTKELAERLSNDYQIAIITYGKTGVSPVLPNTELHLIEKNLPVPIRLALFFIKLLQIIRQFDVIYVQNAVAAGLPVYLACKLFRKKYVLKFVGDEAWERATQRGETKKLLEDFLTDQFSEKPEEKVGKKIKLLLTIQGIVLRGASIVTTPSKYLGEILIKNYQISPEKFLINYNASENEDKPINIPITKKPHQIVATARLTKFKGIDGILEAVNLLKNKYPDISLVVCGDGPELQNLIKLSETLNLQNNVKFLGRVSREETYKYRKESAVYVLNSTYEGLPHTALTSFQAGIPVVATNISGTNEAVYDNVSGLLIEPNNPKMLSEAIDKIFSDPALAEKLIAGGTKILAEKFSWDAHLANLKSFFNSCAS